MAKGAKHQKCAHCKRRAVGLDSHGMRTCGCWPVARRRGTCPTCGREDVPSRNDGTLYLHERAPDLPCALLAARLAVLACEAERLLLDMEEPSPTRQHIESIFDIFGRA